MCRGLGLQEEFFDTVFLLENRFTRLLLFVRSIPNQINPWMGLRHVKYLFVKQLAAVLSLTLASSLLPLSAAAVARLAILFCCFVFFSFDIQKVVIPWPFSENHRMIWVGRGFNILNV